MAKRHAKPPPTEKEKARARKKRADEKVKAEAAAAAAMPEEVCAHRQTMNLNFGQDLGIF